MKTEDKNDRPTEEITHGLKTDKYLNGNIFKSIGDYKLPKQLIIYVCIIFYHSQVF